MNRTGPCRALVALAAIATGSCSPVDADQTRLCRIALPAIEPPGVRIAEIVPSAVAGGVRLDYRATAPNGADGRHFAACRFSPANRLDLLGIATGRGEVAGATVFLLKRYYIGSPEGVAADPGAASP